MRDGLHTYLNVPTISAICVVLSIECEIKTSCFMFIVDWMIIILMPYWKAIGTGMKPNIP